MSTSIHWSYSEAPDTMRGTKTAIASLDSLNYINQGFPYEGPTRLNLSFLSTDGRKPSMMFTINLGRFDYDENCNLTLKFDDGKLFNLACEVGDDLQTLFLPKEEEFMKAMFSSKGKLIVETNLYNHYGQQFTFNTAGLRPFPW